MIIGGNKEKVIERIRLAAAEGRMNDKVETGDPKLTRTERRKLVDRYVSMRKTPLYRISNIAARAVADTATKIQNRTTRIEGLEKLKAVKGGAVVTSNHFNPLDNTVVRYTVNRAGHKRLYLVSQDTNLAMKGWIGFLMNHEDIIPILKEQDYLKNTFEELLAEELGRKQWILIYPEQEMWFNYRKPRPPKRGAYYYAAKNHVPVVSFFVEIINEEKMDNEEFHQVRYVMHVLDPIFPDPDKSVRENSIRMMEQDYRQKTEAYEKAYGKKLEYTFEPQDIAGWIGADQNE